MEVVNLATGEPSVFEFNGWIDKKNGLEHILTAKEHTLRQESGAEAGLEDPDNERASEEAEDITADNLPQASSTPYSQCPVAGYNVTTFTSDVSGAGTDSKVELALIGDKLKAGPVPLESSSDTFERGKVDKFTVEAPLVGTLQKIRISSDGRGLWSAWHLEEVHVTDKSSGEFAVFPFNGWIDKRHGLEHEIPKGRHGQSCTYFIRTHTSDVPGAGTTAKVSAEIRGDKGVAGPFRLRPEGGSRPGDCFKRGRVDAFEVTDVDVGEVESVDVFHDNSGRSPAWHLSKIELQREGSSSAATFPCSGWIGGARPDGGVPRTTLVPGAQSDAGGASDASNPAEAACCQALPGCRGGPVSPRRPPNDPAARAEGAAQEGAARGSSEAPRPGQRSGEGAPAAGRSAGSGFGHSERTAEGCAMSHHGGDAGVARAGQVTGGGTSDGAGDGPATARDTQWRTEGTPSGRAADRAIPLGETDGGPTVGSEEDSGLGRAPADDEEGGARAGTRVQHITRETAVGGGGAHSAERRAEGAAAAPTEYILIVKTGRTESSGAAGHLEVTLHGSRLGSYTPGLFSGNFASGATAYLKFTCREGDLGDLSSADVTLRGRGAEGERWGLAVMEVINRRTGASWVLRPSGWLRAGRPARLPATRVEDRRRGPAPPPRGAPGGPAAAPDEWERHTAPHPSNPEYEVTYYYNPASGRSTYWRPASYDPERESDASDVFP